MNKYDLIIAYLYNKSVQSDREYEQLISNLRCRKADEEDYLECIISKARRDIVDEILLDILKIIGF